MISKERIGKQFLWNSWRRRCGLPPVPVRQLLPTLEELRETEVCHQFDELRMNRKLMGAFRYGLMGEYGKPQFDRVRDAIRRLEQYQKDGNLEHLLDAANMCELEFVEGRHSNRHFAASDDSSHTPVVGAE